MKKVFLLLLIFSILFVSDIFPQDYFRQKENQNRNHLVILHPTAKNLERYTFLIEQGIFDIGKLKLVGVYYENENYDYSSLAESFPNIGFHELRGDLEENEIFSSNDLSKDFRTVFDNSKGVIFSGGPDIPPSIYGEELSLLSNVNDPYRHYFELSFLQHLIGGSRNPEMVPFLRKKPRYFVLGICLGMQTMNVAAGGSLIQDIPTEVYLQESVEEVIESPRENQHRNYKRNFNTGGKLSSYYLHPIRVVPGRWICDNTDFTAENFPHVLSSHHQAVEELAESYRVTAYSEDGKLIEAMEHSRYPNVFAVQFHPELPEIFADDSKTSLKERLSELDSYLFHRSIWEFFSKRLR